MTQTGKCCISVFSSPDTPIKIEEVSIPKLKSGEILVKNEYTTLCKSDINTFSGKRKEKTPTTLGHEIVGKVVAFGEEKEHLDLRGERLKINDRLTWAIYASDPNSDASRAGIPQKSHDLFKYGHEQLSESSNLHGGLGEYTLLRANTPVIKISKSIPLKVAALINCSVATVAGAMRLAGDLRGKNILISGAGMLGVVACAFSKVMGVKKIVVLDVNTERLKIAQDFGADYTLLVEDKTIDFQVAGLPVKPNFHALIELSGVANAMESTLKQLAIGGVAVWVGATYPQRELSINAEQIVRNLWTIKGLHNYNGQDFLRAVEFLENHYQKFPFETLVYDQFTLTEVNQAFEYAISAKPFRVGVAIP